MKTYKVSIVERAYYDYFVEAEDAESAHTKAWDKYANVCAKPDYTESETIEIYETKEGE